MTQFCTNCGAPLPVGARFCARCGLPVSESEIPTEPGVPVAVATEEIGSPPVLPPAVASPAASPSGQPVRPRSSRSGLVVGVLIALVALALVAWALLAGMPFGHRGGGGGLTRATTAEPDVVSEGDGNTATVSQIGESSGTENGTATTQTTATMLQPPISVPQPPISVPQPPISVPQPPISVPQPSTVPPETTSRPPLSSSQPPAAPAARAITEDEAANIVRGYVTSTNYYQTTPDCVGIAPMEYENRGYTIDVVDRCGDRGRLGRWRVDATTREVFVRRADGRYLRP